MASCPLAPRGVQERHDRTATTTTTTKKREKQKGAKIPIVDGPPPVDFSVPLDDSL